VFEEDFLNPGNTSNITATTNNLYIPLRAAYNINISKKLSIIPSLGVCLSHSPNRYSTIETVRNGQVINKRNIESGVDVKYLFGEASLYAGYSFHKLTIMAGPGFKRLLTALNGYGHNHEYLLTADLGIAYRFNQAKK
jgi:hypothetical protein